MSEYDQTVTAGIIQAHERAARDKEIMYIYGDGKTVYVRNQKEGIPKGALLITTRGKEYASGLARALAERYDG